MNRRTKTLLPTARSLLQPRVMYPERDTKLLRKRQTETASHYNRGARSLPELSDGDVIRMKPFRLGDKEWRKATVTGRLDERSYTVETPEGDTYRRNRVHLKKTQETPSEPTDNSDSIGHGDAEKKDMSPALSSPKPTRETGGASENQKESSSTRNLTTPQNSRPQRTRRPPAYLQDYIPT